MNDDNEDGPTIKSQEFVKMNQIRETVHQMVQPITPQLETLKKSIDKITLGIDDRALEIQAIRNDIRKINVQLKQFQDLKRKDQDLDRQISHNDKKCMQQFDQIDKQIQFAQRAADDSHRLAKIAFSMFEERDKRLDGLKDVQTRNHETFAEEMRKQLRDIVKEMSEIQVSVDEAHGFCEKADYNLKRLQESFNKQYNFMFKEQNQRHKNDLNYQQKCDVKFRELDALITKVESFQQPMKQQKERLDKLVDLEWHVERTLPIQFHFAISEVIKAISGTKYLDKLSHFENEKLRQLVDFYKQSRGKEATMDTLSKRILAYAQFYQRSAKGCGSFVLGRDYWPGIREEESRNRDMPFKLDQSGLKEIQLLHSQKKVDTELYGKVIQLYDRLNNGEDTAMGMFQSMVKKLKGFQIREFRLHILRTQMSNEQFDQLLLKAPARTDVTCESSEGTDEEVSSDSEVDADGSQSIELKKTGMGSRGQYMQKRSSGYVENIQKSNANSSFGSKQGSPGYNPSLPLSAQNSSQQEFRPEMQLKLKKKDDNGGLAAQIIDGQTTSQVLSEPSFRAPDYQQNVDRGNSAQFGCQINQQNLQSGSQQQFLDMNQIASRQQSQVLLQIPGQQNSMQSSSRSSSVRPGQDYDNQTQSLQVQSQGPLNSQKRAVQNESNRQNSSAVTQNNLQQQMTASNQNSTHPSPNPSKPFSKAIVGRPRQSKDKTPVQMVAQGSPSKTNAQSNLEIHPDIKADKSKSKGPNTAPKKQKEGKKVESNTQIHYHHHHHHHGVMQNQSQQSSYRLQGNLKNTTMPDGSQTPMMAGSPGISTAQGHSKISSKLAKKSAKVSTQIFVLGSRKRDGLAPADKLGYTRLSQILREMRRGRLVLRDRLRNIQKYLDFLDDLMPEETKQIRRDEKNYGKKGKFRDTDFGKMHDKQRARENQKLYQAIVMESKLKGKQPPSFKDFLMLEQHFKVTTIRNARPKADKADDLNLVFNEKQVKSLQQFLDQSIDWVMLYNRTSIESKVDVIKSKQEENLQELKDFTYRKVDQLQQTSTESQNIIQQAVVNCKQIEQQVIDLTEKFKQDNQSLLQYKQRLTTDIGIRMDKFDKLFHEMKIYLKKVENQNVSLKASISTLLEANMIDSLINGQEFEDRKSLGLIGVEKNVSLLGKNVSLQKQVYKQSGVRTSSENRCHPEPLGSVDTSIRSNINESQASQQSQTSPKKDFEIERVAAQSAKINPSLLLQEGSFGANSYLKHLKMACLTYSSSKVPYRDQNYSQNDLSKIRDKLLLACQDLVGNASVYASEPLMQDSVICTDDPIKHTDCTPVSQNQGEIDFVGSQEISKIKVNRKTIKLSTQEEEYQQAQNALDSIQTNEVTKEPLISAQFSKKLQSKQQFFIKSLLDFQGQDKALDGQKESVPQNDVEKFKGHHFRAQELLSKHDKLQNKDEIKAQKIGSYANIGNFRLKTSVLKESQTVRQQLTTLAKQDMFEQFLANEVEAAIQEIIHESKVQKKSVFAIVDQYYPNDSTQKQRIIKKLKLFNSQHQDWNLGSFDESQELQPKYNHNGLEKTEGIQKIVMQRQCVPKGTRVETEKGEENCQSVYVMEKRLRQNKSMQYKMKGLIRDGKINENNFLQMPLVDQKQEVKLVGAEPFQTMDQGLSLNSTLELLQMSQDHPKQITRQDKFNSKVQDGTQRSSSIQMDYADLVSKIPFDPKRIANGCFKSVGGRSQTPGMNVGRPRMRGKQRLGSVASQSSQLSELHVPHTKNPSQDLTSFSSDPKRTLQTQTASISLDPNKLLILTPVPLTVSSALKAQNFKSLQTQGSQSRATGDIFCQSN